MVSNIVVSNIAYIMQLLLFLAGLIFVLLLTTLLPTTTTTHYNNSIAMPAMSRFLHEEKKK